VLLQYTADTSAARWISESLVPFDRLVTFGPDGFPAYARLRYIPDPTHKGQAESDHELPEDHPSDLEQARRALRVLAQHTDSPRHCFFCIWEGEGGISLPPELDQHRLVDLLHRRYALFEGPLDAIETWEDDFGQGHPTAPPAFVWPADRRWCFASDVDPHWAGIGASSAAVAALEEEPGLDVVGADPQRPQPLYY